MSKRVIVVDSCIDCPYMGEARFDETGKYIGAQCKETHKLTSKSDIPDWCPLRELHDSEGGGGGE